MQAHHPASPLSFPRLLLLALLLALCSQLPTQGCADPTPEPQQEPAPTDGGEARAQETTQEAKPEPSPPDEAPEERVQETTGPERGSDTHPEPSPDAKSRTLIDHKRWKRLEGKEDPFASLRPSGAKCDESGVGFELLGGEETYEIQTGLCNYVTIRQTSLTAVRKGELLQVRVWHFKLTANAPAEARLLLAIGGKTVWDKRVPIPSDSELLAPTWRATADIPAGTNIDFHLHNHGANTWALIELSAQ